MKYFAALLIPLVFFLAACSSNDDNSPTATAPPSGTQSATEPAASPVATAPAATATPEASGPITAANFASLGAVAEADLENLQLLAWQDDGKLLLASRSQAVLLDPSSGQTQTTFTATDPDAIVAASQAGMLATSPDHTTIELRGSSGGIVGAINPAAQFGSVDFSPDGRMLAVSRLDKIAVDLYSVPSGSLSKELTGFQTAAPVYAAHFSANGDSLIWVSRATVQVQEIDTGAMAPSVQHEDFVSGSQLSTDGSRLFTTSAQIVTVWDTAGGNVQATLAQDDIALQPLLLSDGDHLLVATSSEIALWDLGSQTKAGTLPSGARQIALSQDGSMVATSDQNGHVTVLAPS